MWRNATFTLHLAGTKITVASYCYIIIVLIQLNWRLEIATLYVYGFTYGPIHFGDRYSACGVEYVRKLATTGLSAV